MFPKERPGHPSAERMSIALMLEMHMHCLLLGLSPSIHMTCQYYSVTATQNPHSTADLPQKWAMCVYVSTYRNTQTCMIGTQTGTAMHALTAHCRSALYLIVKKKITVIPQNLKRRAKIPWGKGKLVHSHHHRSSYTEATVTFA